MAMGPGQVFHRVALVVALAWGLALATPSVAWSAAGGDRINVNTADASALQALPGIGRVKASAIVAYRAANGPFQRVDDLVRVKGIGPKTLAKLRPLVTCGTSKGETTRPRRGR